MEISRRKFMMGAGSVLSAPAFAAEAAQAKATGPGGVKRFEFGEDGNREGLSPLAACEKDLFEKVVDPPLALAVPLKV